MEIIEMKRSILRNGKLQRGTIQLTERPDGFEGDAKTEEIDGVVYIVLSDFRLPDDTAIDEAHADEVAREEQRAQDEILAARAAALAEESARVIDRIRRKVELQARMIEINLASGMTPEDAETVAFNMAGLTLAELDILHNNNGNGNNGNNGQGNGNSSALLATNIAKPAKPVIRKRPTAK